MPTSTFPPRAGEGGGPRLLLLPRSTGCFFVALVAQDPSAGFRSTGSFFEALVAQGGGGGPRLLLLSHFEGEGGGKTTTTTFS